MRNKNVRDRFTRGARACAPIIIDILPRFFEFVVYLEELTYYLRVFSVDFYNPKILNVEIHHSNLLEVFYYLQSII